MPALPSGGIYAVPAPSISGWYGHLRRGSGVEGDLIAVFGDVRERTVQATNGNQSPELVTPPEAKAPAVVRAARVRVVDALTRSVVPGATVAVGEGKEVAVDPTTTLVLTPGQVRFTVNGVQCLTTSLDLLARTESSGSVLDLPAYPSLVVITGKLVAPGWPVRLKGVTGRVREDCHRLETRTDNQGSFTLFAPEMESGLAVSFGGMVHPIPTGPDSWTLREVQPGVMAPACDLGILSVRPSSNQGIGPVPESVRAPAEAVQPAPVRSVDSIIAANPAPPSGDAAPATASGSRLDSWHWYRRAAATGAIPAVLDLQDDGTPAGQVPNRFLVGTRTPSLDLSEAGTPTGYVPKGFLVGARTPAMDLSAAGHAPSDTFAEIQSAITRSQREAAQAAAAAANAPAPPVPAIAGRWRITSNAGKDLMFTFDQSGRWTSPWGDFSGTWTFRNGQMTMIANRPVTVTITSPNAMHLSTNIEIDLVRAGP